MSIILTDSIMRIEKEVIKFSAALAPRAGGSIFITCADRYFLDIIFFTKELERLIAKRDVYDAERKYGTAYEEISQYPYYINLLRNADRAYMRFDDSAKRPFFEIVEISVPLGEVED